MLILSIPAIFIIEITSNCNNLCPGCGNSYSSHRTQSYMSASTWRKLLEVLGPEAVQIRLSGGEPTLHPEFSHILKIATSYNALVTVFTNGRWKNPMQIIKQLQGVRNLSGLLVSLHGARSESHEAFTRVEGSFNETITNIQLAVRHNIKVTLSTIITHHNWDELNELVMLAQELRVKCVTFSRYIGAAQLEIEPTRRELRSAVECIEALSKKQLPVRYGNCIPLCFFPSKSKGCLAGIAYTAVDPWGNLRPCNFSPTVIGSLHEHSIYELWHSDAMNAWRALMPEECKTCAAYSVCHGGCRAVQELRPDGRDPLRGEPLTKYAPPQELKEIPANAQPCPNFRIREEDFGYVLLGQGQVIPVAEAALDVLEACDGCTSFAQLADRFGQPGLNLLGELWEIGMLEAT